MAAFTFLADRGISRSVRRFSGPRSCALLAHLFSYLMCLMLPLQILFLLCVLYFDFIFMGIGVAVILGGLGLLIPM